MAGTILYKLSLDATKFESGLKTAERQLQKTAANFQKVGKNLSTYITAPIAGLAAVTVRAYDIQAKAEQNLLTALKGRKDIQQSLISQAQALQKTTLFGDEETIKAQALIAAFVKEEDQIKKIIPLVQDMATAKGMDLAGAADLVSKTLGSSTNAMSRYGIQVEGAVGSNERLMSLVNGMSAAFAGQAEAAAKVGAGGIVQLKNAVGDLGEQFGKIVVEYINPFIDKLKAFTERLSNMDESTKRSIVRWAGFAAALGPVVFVIGKIIAVIGTMIKVFRILNATLLGNPIILIIAAIIAAIAGLVFVFKSVKDSIYAFAGYFEATWNRIQIIFLNGKTFVLDTIQKLINSIFGFFNRVASKLGLEDMFEALDFSDKIDKDKAKIQELQSAIDNNKWKDISDVWSEFSGAAANNFKKVTGIFSVNMDSIQEKATETGDVISGALSGGGSGGGGSRKTPKMEKIATIGDANVLGTEKANEGLENMSGWLERQSQQVNVLNEGWMQFKETMSEFASSVVPGITDAFGQMIAGTKGAFSSLVSSVLDGLKRIINGLLAQAIAGVIAGESKKGLLGLITASIGIGALTAIWNSKVPKLATGGVIPGGFPNDTYPALLSSGETVLPKPKALSGMMGGYPSEVRVRMSYDELIGVLNFGNKRAGS